MHENGLPFERLHERRLHRVDKQRAHRAVHAEIGRGDARAGPRAGERYLRKASAQVGEIGCGREDGHHFRSDRYVETGRAVVAVEGAAGRFSDLDVSEPLRAEIDCPAELYARRIHVETFERAFGEPRVVVVAFVLHARIERDHREIVRVGDGVYVACEAERKRRQRHRLREPAARGRALDVESGAARRLADASDDALSEPAEPFHEPEGRSGFAFAERGRRYRCDVDVFPPTAGAGPRKYSARVELGEKPPVRLPFVFPEIELSSERRCALERRKRRFGDLPVFHFEGI